MLKHFGKISEEGNENVKVIRVIEARPQIIKSASIVHEASKHVRAQVLLGKA